ncbi:Bud emergence protein 1 [Fusarium sp. LHS14.1]|nr:Bud emergence protein 1 [Fusarium sp. LHS14.1]
MCLSSLLSQLSALEASTTEIESILRKRESSLSQQNTLTKTLKESLTACNTAINYLFSEVCEARELLETGKSLRWWMRTRYALDEDALAPAKEALRDQVQAIQLLLSVLALTNENEQEKVLNDADSVAVLKKVSDDSSSLLWLRDADSRLSFISMSTDTLSRLSMTFGFDGDLLDSKPYRAAVKLSWKRLRMRDKDGSGVPPVVTRPQSLGSMLPNDSRSNGRALAMIVRYDFQAQRADELECKEGEVLIPVAISDSSDDWVVTKPIGRLGGPGLVPISFLCVVARSGATYETKDEILQELRDSGIPLVSEWLVLARRQVDSAITLGSFKEDKLY